MDLVITFSRSAFKHGVSEDDIRRAFTLKLLDHPIEGDEKKNLLVGFDTHAMPCRNTFIAMIDEE